MDERDPIAQLYDVANEQETATLDELGRRAGLGPVEDPADPDDDPDVPGPPQVAAVRGDYLSDPDHAWVLEPGEYEGADLAIEALLELSPEGLDMVLRGVRGLMERLGPDQCTATECLETSLAWWLG